MEPKKAKIIVASTLFDADDHSHRRYNPLLDEWVLVAPHRMKRPWKGQVEPPFDFSAIPKHDPQNGLCPGVTRSSGEKTPEYTSTYVFENDFPSLADDLPQPSKDQANLNELMKLSGISGECRVMCFHPHTNMTLPLMDEKSIGEVIDTWSEQLKDLGKRFLWVQIFENKGAAMGCSNPHPHCQIWASNHLPNIAYKKDKTQKEYFVKHGKQMLLDYASMEIKEDKRVVLQNDDWIVVVPWWALWPFETMILPKKRHILRLTDLTTMERDSLATIMKKLLIRYDNLFETSFPYSMGWHGAPTGTTQDDDVQHWQLHAIYYPPLLRSASVKKFMVGYEMHAEGQRDLTAEQATKRLKDLSEDHYFVKKQTTSKVGKNEEGDENDAEEGEDENDDYYDDVDEEEEEEGDDDEDADEGDYDEEEEGEEEEEDEGDYDDEEEEENTM
eukprot:m.95488 g.95488  ORF g.95488 m.95488 type:complete len:443 (-) comp8949_c0_seq1:1179-2507(-)